MEYWKEIFDDNNFIYSCDMVRLKFEFKEDAYEELVKYFVKCYRTDIKTYPLNTSDFKYRYMFVIEYQKSSMTVGIGFNGSKREDLFIGFAEFNPNKCFLSEQCFVDLQIMFAAAWSYELVRWDLAIDIPIARKFLSLVKDGRRYETVLYSVDNKTEYLGIRNEPGRTKLYNKALEDKREDTDALSRLELTCDGSWSTGEILNKLPYVDTLKTQNELTLAKDLSNTQRVLVDLINASGSKTYYFKMLNASMQCKLRKYIFDDDNKICYDRKAIDETLRQLKRTLRNFESGYYYPDTKTIWPEEEVNPFVSI